MFKRLFLLNIISFLGCTLYASNRLSSTYPTEGQKLPVLSQIVFTIDCSDSYNDSYSKENIGVRAAFSTSTKAKRWLSLYKGDASTGTLLETVKTAAISEIGSTTIVIGLSKEYKLDERQLYTIIIPTDCFWTWHDSYSSANVIDRSSPADTITFYGGEEEGQLSYQGANPESGDAKELGVITLNFNQEIKLAENAKASLYSNDTTLVKEVPLTVSQDSANAAVADFGNERLLIYNNYSVKVPKETIMKNDTTNTTLDQDILVSYTGTSYYLFKYKTITPDSGSVLSTIGEVVLIPDFPAGSAAWEYCGDDAYKGNVSLYKGTDETGELVGTYEFDMGSDLKSERGNVTAILEPNETYALVIPEGLVPTRGSITIGNLATNMRQTHRSAKTTVLYTGAPYAGITYKVGNTSIKVNDVRRGSSLTFNVAQSDTISLDSLSLDGVNVTKDIASDSTYTIDSLMNDAVLEAYVSYKSSQPKPEYASVSYKANGITVASEQVLKGSKVSVNMAMPDSIQLDSLMLNGEKVTLADSAYAIDRLAADAEIEAALTYIPTPAPETKFYAVDYKVLSVANDSTMLFTTSSAKVAEDSIFTFKTPELDDNWSVEVSAGEMSEDSIYSVVVVKDTSVVVTCKFNGDVTYVDETTNGVFSLDNQEVKISTTEGKIVVEGAKAGNIITLYSLNGVALGNWTVEKDQQTIDVNSGVYLVVVKGDAGKAAAKVSVK